MEIKLKEKETDKKTQKPASSLLPTDKISQKILNDRAHVFAKRSIENIEKKNLTYIRFSMGPNNELYGIPYHCALEVIHNIMLTIVPNSAGCIAGVINYRGAILTVIDLKNFFYNSKSQLSADSYVIIVNGGGLTVGVLIDNIQGSNSYDPNFIEDPLPSQGTIKSEYISGIHQGATAILNIEILMNVIQSQVKSREKI
jgi:purine-binding chemotaxis protein CheW